MQDLEQELNASNKKIDMNGYIVIENNPISAEGVFQYLGSQIDPSGKLGLDQKKVYEVYRSAEELSDQACIDSFKLVPFIDEHVMLGRTKDGLMPAERKGVQGTTGENVFFDSSDGFLKSNLKIFSEKLANLIESGKKELSIGYRCVYDLISGVFEGKRFDIIQKNIRANHLALVQEGRSGHEVAVLDSFVFTCDTGLIMKEMKNESETKDELSLEDVMEKLNLFHDRLEKLEKVEDEDKEDEDKEDEDKKDPVLDEDKETPGDGEKKDNEKMVLKNEDEDEDLEEKEKEKKKDKEKDYEKAMDSALKKLRKEMHEIPALAKDLAACIGTFDHSCMSLKEVAEYGVKKLKLKCSKGHELDTARAYLAAKKTQPTFSATAMDSSLRSKKSSSVSKYLEEVK